MAVEMRFAFVCFFPAVPPESGAGRVSYDLARFVPGESLLIQLGPADGDWSDSEGLRVVQLEQGRDGRWGKLLGMPRFVARVVERLRATRPNMVVLEGASWVLYHWWLMRAIRNALPRLRIVYHAHNVEHCLRAEKHGWLVRCLTYWAEGRLVRNADQSFAVSDVDRDIFEELYGIRPSLLPNGVDLAHFSSLPESTVQACRERYGLDSNTLLFMGSYAYRPNREAIDFLITRVMPRVLEQQSDARLAIIGGDVPYSRDWLCCPGVIADEWVGPFVCSCAISVAPIFSGSGTRLKILASLAAGIPVVSTAKGAEGLDIGEAQELLIAEKPEEFAIAVVRLLASPAQRAKMGLRGRETVMKRYDARILASRLLCPDASIGAGERESTNRDADDVTAKQQGAQ